MANLTFLEALNKSLGVTKKYIDNSVAGIVDSAPETLNTLKELSTALGDDPNFATTVATNIGKKVDKIEGKTLTANDLTNELKANYDTAYTHSQVAHAPADAQKNSDITKDEIEAKLIGDVSSHTHSQYLTEHQSLDEYATKNNPVFTGSMSSGRKEEAAVGENSFAVGSNVEASGESSHAEGSYTTASGNYSHAEGNYSKALSDWAHAEGNSTTASGKYSHAEGNSTTALGESSHTEGSYSKASSDWSHAEGYHTTASSQYQHVQGKYNIEDTANKYAHIVGNGTTNIKRSNAHTLDWQGNAWYSGKLSQEGTPTEDKDLVTKKYVDNKMANLSIVKISKTDFEALTTKDANTLYLVLEDS